MKSPRFVRRFRLFAAVAALAVWMASVPGFCGEPKPEPKAKIAPKAKEPKAKEKEPEDPRAVPTHEELATIAVFQPGESGRVHAFCATIDGYLLVCCEVSGSRAVRTKPQPGSVKPQGEIRMMSPEGALLIAFPLTFVPEAICQNRDGTVFAGGGGKVARLERFGRVVKIADSPALAEFEAEKKKAEAKKAEAEKKKAGKEEPKGKDSKPAGKEEKKASVSGALFGALGVATKPIVPQTAAQRADIERKQQEEALARYRESRKGQVPGIGVTDKDVFVACPSAQGFGYAVWRLDHNLGEPKKIVDQLRGCCGQMDVHGHAGDLWVAENGRHAVVRYDRDGKKLASWGKADRKGIEGFGGCCNPKNLRFTAKGDEVITTDSGPPEVVKRCTLDGKLLGVIALPDFRGGCVRMTTELNDDDTQVLVLNTSTSRIHVYVDKRYAPTHKRSGNIALTERPAPKPGAPQVSADVLPEEAHSFTLGADGNLLVACGGSRQVHEVVGEGAAAKVRSMVLRQDAEVRVLDPAGKRLKAFKIDLTPTAIAASADGEIYVGGNGRLARLDKDGKTLAAADAPALAEFLAPPKKPAKAEAKPAGDKVAGDKKADPKAKAKAKSKPRSSDEEKQAETAALEQARLQARISGIAPCGNDVFVAGYGRSGLSVWRLDRSLANPKQIVSRLSGCCGQMDIHAKDGFLYVAENGRKRVSKYDRDGKLLSSFGSSDRKGVEGFGSCCNPMNIRLVPSGEIWTSESGSGRVKRYSMEGKFLGVAGYATGQSGCKHVPIAVSKDMAKLYVFDIGKQELTVLTKPDRAASSLAERDDRRD